MIDFVKLRLYGLAPSDWLQCVELAGQFPLEVVEETGDVLQKPREARYHDLTFKMVPKLDSKEYTFALQGSLHKYFNRGIHNNNRFTLADLVEVVEDLSERFRVEPGAAVLEGVEIGLNLSLPFPVARLLASVVSYKGKPFAPIDPRNVKLGKLCSLSDYDIKLYDKYKQAVKSERPLPEEPNLLRFEVRVKKMRWLKGVQVLADLTKAANIYPFIEVLSDLIGAIVFIDAEADVTRLTDRQKAVFYSLRSADAWETPQRWQRQELNRQLDRILKKCNALRYGDQLAEIMADEWERLFCEAEKTLRSHQLIEAKEAIENPTFSPLGLLKKNVGNEAPILAYLESALPPPDTPPPRYCRSCGKEISMQKPGSVFCSEKYNGKNGRQCRNKDSNPRRTKRAIIMRAQIKDQYLIISYLSKGVVYTDTLHSSEVGVSRHWLDSVVSVRIVPEEVMQKGQKPEGQLLVYDEARQYLQEVTTGNIDKV